MPLAAHDYESSGGFEQPISLAGKMQINNVAMPNGVPSVGQTIAGSGSWTSGTIFADGYQIISVAVQMNQAGTLKITRYLDTAGTIARPVSSTSIVSGTLLIVDITDDLPFLTYTIEIDNGSGSTATIAAFACIMNAD
jgi:hypothetical protein